MWLTQFQSKQRRSVFKKLLRLFGIPDFSETYLYSDGLWKKKSFKLSTNSELLDDIFSIYYKDQLILTSSSLCELKQSRDWTNQKVFIVGSGPSIKDQNLEFLKNENVILLNGSCLLIKELHLKASTLVISDDSFVQKRGAYLREIFDFVQKNHFQLNLVLSFRVLRAIYNYKLLPCLAGVKVFLFEEILQEEKIYTETVLIYGKDGTLENNEVTMKVFSKMNRCGVFHCGSVMTAAIQYAALLGFEKVYLLGLDIGNSKQPRFYENDKNVVRSGLLDDYEKGILPFMQLASKWYKENNRHIYNCSPITLLPYEVIPFFDIGSFSIKSN